MNDTKLINVLHSCDFKLLNKQLAALIDLIDQEKQSADVNREHRAELLSGLEELISSLISAQE